MVSIIKQISFFLEAYEIIFISRREKERKTAEEEIGPPKNITFTDEQKKVYQGLQSVFAEEKHSVSVLHGVTGSGKTEIYNALITDLLEKKKAILFLVPEVTLALHFESVLKRAHGKEVVFGFHSASSVAHKRKLWKALRANLPIIIVGVHLPYFCRYQILVQSLLMKNMSLDFKKKTPESSLSRYGFIAISIISSSCFTWISNPLSANIVECRAERWNFFEMKQRFSGAFPEIELVSLKEKHARRNFWISNQLSNAIQEQLERGEQTILFLNRRGVSFFVQCTCGEIFSCKSCSVSLTLHADNCLVCHYCGFQREVPKHCSECGVEEKEFIKRALELSDLLL